MAKVAAIFSAIGAGTAVGGAATTAIGGTLGASLGSFTASAFAGGGIAGSLAGTAASAITAGAGIFGGLSSIGSIISGVGALQSGFAASAAADSNAAIARRNSDLAIQQSMADAADRRRLLRRQIGSARLASGGAGGTFTDVIADNAVEGELDALRILNSGRIQSQSLLLQSSLEKNKSRQALIGGFIGAGTKILRG